MVRASDPSEARLEAELLLAHALGLERRALWTLEQVPAEAARTLERLVQRRVADGRPLAYLTGRQGFHELDLAVDGRVLIPRPETELLVERLLARLDAGEVPEGPLADWGTGSGCVALSLASRRPVLALDRSAGALAVAAVNRTTGPPARPVWLVRADGLSPVREASLGAVAANPPYVTAAEWADLAPDVRDHEPRSALVPADGDVPGLYTRLGRRAARCLRPGGWLLAEVGAGQAPAVAAAWTREGLEVSALLTDLGGHQRVVEARRPA